MIPCKPRCLSSSTTNEQPPKKKYIQIPESKDILICNPVFRCFYNCKRSLLSFFGKPMGEVRGGNIKLYWAFKRLYWFRYAMSGIDKIPKWIVVFFIIVFSIMLAYCTLSFFTPTSENAESLKSLISKGLLIAPLVNMLNSGNMHVLNTYRKAFGKKEEGIEPRFVKIQENYEFLSSIVMFDKVKKHQRIKEMYLRYSRKVIVDSIKSRSDSEYHNHFSTIWIGILILVGYMFLFAGPYFTVSLVILFGVYLSLILKNIGALRVDGKQRILEQLHVLLKEDYEKNNIEGEAFIRSASL